MPTYEFECRTCFAEYERTLPMSHEPQHCDKCGMELKKLISLVSPGFINKGFTDSFKAEQASKLKKRNRGHFVKKGRDEAIANGATHLKRAQG